MKEIGIYIHIPFCKSKCNYCDFNSFANKNELIEKYVQCLQKEIENAEKEAIVKTIYIGGGTPSCISEEYIKSISKTVYKNFEIDKDVEFTIEVNPRNSGPRKTKNIYGFRSK